MKAPFPAAVAAALAAAVLVCGCGADDGLIERIRDSVKEAKAPAYAVDIGLDPADSGEAFPFGRVSRKKEVPFTVRFTADDSYVFEEWQALDGDEEAGAVRFTDASSSETAVVLDGAPASGVFSLRPFAVPRPLLASVNIPGGGIPRVPCDYELELRFTTPLYRPSVVTADSFTVSGVTEYGRGPEIDLKSWFALPSLDGDGTLVTFSLLRALPINCDIAITLKTGVVTADYRAPLFEPVTIRFGTTDKLTANAGGS
jgi:hypothetical protein